ncbi:MAG: DUF4914 family protein [Halieaceae bacterium]|jgi:hypothetical protein|nr:DUF4914 family protein [Halieaceae bacterium]
MDAASSRDDLALGFRVPTYIAELLREARSVAVPETIDILREMAVCDAGPDGWHDVAYEVPGRGRVVEARVACAKNGIVGNYLEPYMRRRDPDCMVIGDNRPTDKPRYSDRFGGDFSTLREETFAWLKGQDLVIFAFEAGMADKGRDAIAIAPANAGFFAFGLALLQGMIPRAEVPESFDPTAVVFVAPPFRHTHFEGKQVVVHNRLEAMHELFSYNLYPGPSAKKGIYGVLLNLGESESWLTMHCATVQVVTPYHNKIVITHEGASGGGKSEMLEHPHRNADGSILIGENVVSGETRTVSLPRGCQLRPVTDDMALCHPDFDKGHGKLSLMDAEESWFVRVNHIDRYGVDPNLERLTIHPETPLLFLNIDAQPGSTALIWEHIEDEPGVPCPNPRVVVPRKIVPGVMPDTVDVGLRSFGVRCPPCTAEAPSYGILGMFHLLPPALAWLWRLVAPRGHANPSIVSSEGMSSEGVGSYWPFATGRRVDQANLLLRQIQKCHAVRYTLIPNQHVGAWRVGFSPQWIAREYFARRGGAEFSAEHMKPSQCALLGYNPTSITVEGRTIGTWFFQVATQPEVGQAAYDEGSRLLKEFFASEISQFLVDDLDPVGREIIETCLADSPVEAYESLIPHGTLIED